MTSLANNSSNSSSFGWIVSTNSVKRKQASGLISLSLSFPMIKSRKAVAEADKLSENFSF